MKKKQNLYWLAESAVMIALAAVLEFISKQFIPELPWGGQITIVAMLPVILVAWKYGIGRGILTAFAYSFVQMALGANSISGMIMPSSDDYLGSVGKVILMLLLDYIVAFTVLGFASMYKKVIKKSAPSFALGAFTVIMLRYICHICSGYILFSSWAEWFFSQDVVASWGMPILEKFSGNTLSIIYSIIYNGLFIVPEAIFTTIAAAIVGNIPQIMKVRK